MSPAWRRYLPLTKPTISLLVVVTVIPSLFLASGAVPSVKLCILTMVGTFLASASASVFNHILDADIDLKMARTSRRPLASGEVKVIPALILAVLLGIFSLSLLCAFANPLTAGIALAANLFYVLVYTLLLKRTTDQNIVIGGAAGSVGPLIGWAAVSGQLAWPAWALFLIIFLWTPPHFWSLALKYKHDYSAANIPMLPVTRGEPKTRSHIFLYTLTLFPPVIAIYLSGEAGHIYGLTSLVATAFFSLKAWKLLRAKDSSSAMSVFHYSCLYLFIVFGALTLDRIISLV